MFLKKEYFIQFFLFILVAFGISYIYTNANSYDFQKTIINVEQEIENISNNFESITKQEDFDIYNENIDDFKSFKDNLLFDLYIYENKKLVFWSNNAIPEINPSLFENEIALVSLKNGYYIAFKKQKENKIYIGLALLRNSYSLVNKYLSNSYSTQFNFQDDDIILPALHTSGQEVKVPKGEVLFRIQRNFNNSKKIDNNKLILSIAVYLMLFSLFLLIVLKFNKIHPILGLGLNLFLGLIWVYSVNFIPFEFKKSVLFSSSLYGSGMFSSLGQLMLFVVFMLTLSYHFMVLIFKNKLYISTFFKFSISVLTVLSFLASTLILRSLVLDSIVNYSTRNLAMFDTFSVIGLLIAFFVSLTYVFGSIVISKFLKNLQKSIWFLIFSSVSISAILYYLGFKEISFVLALLFLLFNILLIKQKSETRFTSSSFTYALLCILFIVAQVSIIFSVYSTIKINNNKRALAYKIAIQRDFTAEDLFINIEKKIRTDDFVKNYFKDPMFSYKNLYKRLVYKYFEGYFTKFDIAITAFNNEGKVIKKNSLKSLDEYYSLINKHGEVTLSSELFYVQNKEKQYSYLSLLQITDNKNTYGTLAIKISPKTYDVGNVYPELLLEGKNKLINQNENEYEYGIYNNDYLISKQGNFLYPQSITSLDFTNFNHFIFNDSNTLKKVVISTKKQFFSDKISLFSFILSFYLILGFAILLIVFNLLSKKNRQVFQFSFRKKITASMLILVVSSFIIFGMVTISYFSKQYNSYHKKRLIRKQNAISKTLNYIVKENKIETGKELKNYFLKNMNFDIIQMSDVHSMDINLFNLGGHLHTSSQDGIFTSGLISSSINSEAFILLKSKKVPLVVQDEKIGNLNYLSAYVPIYNNTNEVISYLNIPYFSKEKNLKKDISNFMISLVNVYILLLIIGSIVAFFVSNSLTKPLKQISEKLRGVSLNKKSLALNWDTDDEIGALVNEYNKMIVELEHSANLLAKNERDEAWREMAKQIAHEIKNPLTPMKLSIQHLQRALKDDPSRAVGLAERVTVTLIEQINNLTDIATAFSSFAKMPIANKEEVVLEEVLNASIDLFSRENHLVRKRFTIENAIIFADKNQMISVFNNLVKNAIQATEEKQIPDILVSLIEEGNHFLISIKDNGVGIPEQKKNKIFVPNFTTKSSGTGLGLAISKQIIENLKGSIWFESKENEFTIFYVKIPKYIKSLTNLND